MSARLMTRDEETLFCVQIVATEIMVGLRCGNCMQRACSLEYGPFECRGEKPMDELAAACETPSEKVSH